jgi:aldehyde dehydrogenase (NAD+)
VKLDPETAAQTRHDHWIGGQPVGPTGGTYLPTLNPTTCRSGDEIAAGTSADVERAVSAARGAQQAWAERSSAERSDLLHLIAEAIHDSADALVAFERACTGKPEMQAWRDVEVAASYFRYYAGIVRHHSGRTIDQGAGTHTYTRLEPYGVVAVITPWNMPLTQACRGIAPALAVGNTVVVKPSEFTSPSTLQLARVASVAGVPDGVLNVVTGTGVDVGTPLAAHPDVRRIVFTGSVATGRHLASIAGDRIVPMTLELGGKSPLVAFADADPDRVVAAAVSTVVYNAGQICSATSRLLVEASVHDELVERVVDAIERLEPGVDFGPMITESQYAKVLDYFADARAQGLEPLTGGAAYHDGPSAAGQFIRPTVYADVSPISAIAREEIFGPVLVTTRFADEAEAVALANDTEYGLVASVWSGDLTRALRLAERLEAGQVTVNGGPLTIETPFGGYKQSGYGREKGVEALDEYVQIKTISVSMT